jgi:hypothetical protein
VAAKRKAKNPVRGMSETARTIYLLVLLFAGLAFILWAESQYEANFVETF